jgi:hypothetical protein
MSRFWSKVVHEVEPYVPGEQPKIDDLIKLNTNENPYPPSARVAEVLGEPGTIERLRLYPDPESTRLKQAIASYYGVQQNQIFVGNGSDEVLGLLFKAFFQQDKPLLLPDITYSFYPVYCQLFGITIERIPVRDDFRIDLADFDRPNGGLLGIPRYDLLLLIALGIQAWMLWAKLETRDEVKARNSPTPSSSACRCSRGSCMPPSAVTSSRPGGCSTCASGTILPTGWRR